MREDIDNQREYITSLVESGATIQDLCVEFNCQYSTIVKRLNLWGLVIDRRRKTTTKPSNSYLPASHYLREGSPISSAKLKTKLLRDGIKTERCERCGLTEWLGFAIPLELHHINGNKYDNRLDNLILLCSNCHSLEPNNKGASPQARVSVSKNYCIDCGASIGMRANRCKSCKEENVKALGKKPKTKRGKEWPNIRELLNRLRENTFQDVAASLGVSDNALRKHLRSKYDIDPTLLSFYNKSRLEHIDAYIERFSHFS